MRRPASWHQFTLVAWVALAAAVACGIAATAAASTASASAASAGAAVGAASARAASSGAASARAASARSEQSFGAAARTAVGAAVQSLMMPPDQLAGSGSRGVVRLPGTGKPDRPKRGLGLSG